jgi:hypothetical protein
VHQRKLASPEGVNGWGQQNSLTRFKRPCKTLFVKTLALILLAFVSSILTSCLTQRTVSEGGRTVKQQYVIKRPISDAIKNSR